MSRMKTTEEFKKEVYSLVGNEYRVASEYRGAHKKILLIHDCGFNWWVKPDNFLQGQRCPKEKYLRIGNSNRFDISKIRNLIDVLGNGEYELLSNTYHKAKDKLLVRHKKCNYIYPVSYSDFKSGRRCPKCAFFIRTKKESKTIEEFKQEVYDLVGKEYIVLSKNYKNWRTPVKFYHVKCGHTFNMEPNSFLQGERCSICNGSYGEKWILNYLDRKNITYEYQKRFKDLYGSGRPLSYDFYLPEYHMLIEYQGKQHYYPVKLFNKRTSFKKRKEYDKKKRNYAINNGYYFLAIPYLINNSSKLDDFLNMIFTVNAKVPINEE